MRESAGLKLVLLFISYEVSRGPKVNIGKSKSPKVWRTHNMRKSRSSKVSCEVSCQIGLVINLLRPNRIAAVAQSLRRLPPTLRFQVQIPPTHNFYNFTSF